MPTDISKAHETVVSYLSDINSLLEKSFKEGWDEKEALLTRIEHFISFAFPDGKERLENNAEQYSSI